MLTVNEIKTGDQLAQYLKELEKYVSETGQRASDALKMAGVNPGSEWAQANGRKYMTGAAAQKISVHEAEQFGRFCKAVARRDVDTMLEMDGGGAMPEVKAGEALTKAALGTPLTGDSVSGSYLIPTQLLAMVVRISAAKSDLMNRVTRVQMSSRTATVPTKNAGLTLTWVTTQGSDLTEKNPTFLTTTLTAFTGAGFIGVTEEMLEDEPGILGQYIAELAGEAWGAAFDSALLTDNAAPFTGILRNSSCNLVTMNAGKSGFGDAKMDDLNAMIAALTTKAQRNGSCWMMHPTLLDVFCNLRNANGDYILRQADAVAQPASMLGYPVLLSDSAPDIGSSAKATPFLAFGRPDLLMHGDRIGLELKYFDNTMYAVRNCEGIFRIRVRAGFGIPIPTAFSVLKTAAA